MGSDKILKKSAFGGFKKEGVLNYVEKLQAEILSLKKELNNTVSCDENRKLEEKCKEYEAIVAEADSAKKLLETENLKLVEDNKVLSAKYQESLKSISDYETKIILCENKIAEIEKKFSEIETLYENASQTDNKANAMMLDAVNYSEKIVAKANEKVDSAMADAASVLRNAFAVASDASDKLKTSKNNFESSTVALDNALNNLKFTLADLAENFAVKTENEADCNG